MSNIYIANLAVQNAGLLAVRQSLIASNIANANTPNFKAQDVRNAQAEFSATSALTTTNQAHMNTQPAGASGIEITQQEPWDIYHSGGNVSLAQEMLKSGEVASDYQLNTSVMKSFHRMVVSVFGS